MEKNVLIRKNTLRRRGKKYLVILLFMFSIKAYNQNIDLENICFSCGNKSFLTNSCSFYFECDCCNSCLFFEEDSIFYSFGLCLDKNSAQKGTYSIKNNTLELHYNGIVAYKNTEEKVFPGDSTDAPYFVYVFYTDSVFEPFTETYRIDKCGEKPMLIHDKYNFYRCLHSESIYAGCDEDVEDMFSTHYREWLDLLEARHFDLLKNLNTYSQELDSIILKKLAQIQDTSNIYIDDSDYKNKISMGSTFIEEGKVIYSPDDKFKIFTFSGSNYRSSYDYSMAQLQSGKFIETGFTQVNSIHKTGENLYAVIHKSWGGGLMGRTSISISLVKIENDSLYCVPFIFEPTMSYVGYRTDAINIFNYWWMSSPYIKHIENNKFCYKYGMPLEGFQIIAPNTDLYLRVEGEFTLINDKISNIKETYMVINYDEDFEEK